MTTSYENLINAIIVQAVKDYRVAKKKLKKHPDSLESKRTLIEVEQFLLSDWFVTLTDVDGSLILQKIKTEGRE